jgi:hypothetical protein
MSGVLERMILRTRSALAGIEPVFAPRYAAREVSHEAGNRPVEPGVPRASARTEPARSSPATAEFSEEVARATPVPRHDPAVDEMPSPRSAGDHVHVSLTDVSSDALAPSLPTTPARQEEPAANEPVVVSARTRPTAGTTAPSTPSRVALGHKAEPVVDLFNESATPASTGNKHVAPAAPGAPASVTISIGHVEVRAAPVSSPARRPAFRPRVTLDEYLRRSGDKR